MGLKAAQNRQPQNEARKILVVDDQPENIHILIEHLTDEYQVLFATSGQKALEIALSDSPPDVILLDIMMPSLDGFEVCSQLKSQDKTKEIPIIFVSALDQEIDEAKGLNLGAVDFITKPFRIPVVKARIKSVLRLKDEMERQAILTRQLQDLNLNLEKMVNEKTTALQQAHANIEASEKKYRTIYENSIEGIFETSPEGLLISASPSLIRIMGYDAADHENSAVIPVMDRLIYLHPEDRQTLVGIMERNGEVRNFETRMKKKDGTVIWVSISAKVIHDSSSGRIRFQGFLLDITERKLPEIKNRQLIQELALLNRIIAASMTETRAEAILTISCRELAEAFQLPQAAALVLNPERTKATIVAEYIAINDQSLQQSRSFRQETLIMADHPRLVEIFNSNKALVVDDVFHDQRFQTIAELFSHRRTKSFLLIPLILSGRSMGCLILEAETPYPFTEEQVSLARSVADQVSGVLARIQLDEERHQLEAQYFQAQKMEAIGQLTGAVAHDFNNILTIILGVSDLMLLQQKSNSPLYEKIGQIKGAATKAADLVRQLMAFSRQQILQPDILNLNKVISNFEKMLHRIIGENIQLHTFFDPHLGQVKADPGQIEQVLMNLVVNARDAMPQGGELSIETSNVILDEKNVRHYVDVKPGKYVLVCVSDTGKGMDDEIQAHIFEPFFTTKAKGEGTGLGLSTVHGIINQSGGHIWVYSEPGQGTVFKIYLPTIEQEPVTHEMMDEQLQDVTGGSETILVVEDDKIVREMVCDTLKTFGYNTLEADCAASADTILTNRQKAIDLLVTDVIMPGNESGIQLAERHNRMQPQLKVLFMSGYTDKTIISQGLLESKVNYIAKPFLPINFAKKVREVLDRKK
jgi:PAS domain S-box-containing protein